MNNTVSCNLRNGQRDAREFDWSFFPILIFLTESPPLKGYMLPFASELSTQLISPNCVFDASLVSVTCPRRFIDLKGLINKFLESRITGLLAQYLKFPIRHHAPLAHHRA
jgi:hypothetical protein